MNKKTTNLLTTLGMTFLMIAMSSSLVFAQQKSPYVDVKTCSDKEFSEKIDAKDFVSKQYKDGTVVITEMIGEYLFPTGIDATGKHVIIQTFGSAESSYYYSQPTGLVTFPGTGTKVTTEGIVAGDFLNVDFPGGGTAITAGTYDLSSEEWTFLGINPEYPNVTSEDYNSAWGQSDDGSIIVGMHMHADWSATAFKWTADGGYDNIGNSQPNSSRASGVSRNGEVIYGWASTDFGNWLPIIWHNDGTFKLIDEIPSGEAMGASPEGTYVVGSGEENPFYWTAEEGVVTFGTPNDFPTLAMEDGSIFGFSGIFPPTDRRAFHRSPEGIMGTFNDYAEARGMANAQDWIFYSVNDATPDGNVFIGAGVNPNGMDVSFIIDFDATAATEYTLSLSAEPQEGGEVNGSGNYEEGAMVSIEAEANEGYEFVNWTNEDGSVVSTDASTSISMPANDYHLIANFEMLTVYYTLSLEANPAIAGTLTGAGSYEANEEVNITAEVIGYYEFDNWTNEAGDIVSEEANATIIMPAEDLTLMANFHSTVGISNLRDSQINVYPNPVKEVLTIDGLQAKEVQVLIFNTIGAVVYDEFIKGNQINITNIQEGLYIVQIKEGTQIVKNQRITIIK